MCEVHVYFKQNGTEEKLLESVERVERMDEGRIIMRNIFGEEKTVSGRMILFDSGQNKILLEPVQ